MIAVIFVALLVAALAMSAAEVYGSYGYAIGVAKYESRTAPVRTSQVFGSWEEAYSWRRTNPLPPHTEGRADFQYLLYYPDATTQTEKPAKWWWVRDGWESVPFTTSFSDGHGWYKAGNAPLGAADLYGRPEMPGSQMLPAGGGIVEDPATIVGSDGFWHQMSRHVGNDRVQARYAIAQGGYEKGVSHSMGSTHTGGLFGTVERHTSGDGIRQPAGRMVPVGNDSAIVKTAIVGERGELLGIRFHNQRDRGYRSTWWVEPSAELLNLWQNAGYALSMEELEGSAPPPQHEVPMEARPSLAQTKFVWGHMTRDGEEGPVPGQVLVAEVGKTQPFEIYGSTDSIDAATVAAAYWPQQKIYLVEPQNPASGDGWQGSAREIKIVCELPTSAPTPEETVVAAIRVVMVANLHLVPSWKRWGDSWISGEDRSPEAAKAMSDWLSRIDWGKNSAAQHVAEAAARTGDLFPAHLAVGAALEAAKQLATSNSRVALGALLRGGGHLAVSPR